jgi:hypothetical protein
LAVAVDKIPYIDFPELKLDEHESTEMPFRYVIDVSGKPIMPEVGSWRLYRSYFNKRLTGVQGMIDLIKADADKAFDDLEFVDEADGLQNLDVGKD